MRNRTCVYCLVMSAVAVLSGPGLAVAQSLSAVPVAATATTVVPSLVRYAGVVAGHDGKTVSATFLVFKDETGGVPLWSEAQMVTPDAAGHFEVYLGAANVSGLPVELFGTGEARWVEVQMAGLSQQPRVLLASVPYAMKAADAATLGGLPASAYALAATFNATAAAANTAAPDATAHTVTTTDGTTGYLPVFSGATTIDDSIVFQSGTKIGIGTKAPAATLDIEGAIIGRGLLTLEATGVATATAGKDSQALELMASAYSSSLKKAETPVFSLQAEPATNNTTTPGATLNFLYGATGTPTETGLSISSKGILKFATGQTFPGGGGTITGVTTTAPLTGSGTTGSVTVGLNLTTLETSLNAKYAQLGAADKFTGLITFGTGQTFPGTSKITSVTAGTGLLGGGTTGAVTLSLNPAAVPTLTSSPVFTSSADAVTGDTAGGILNTAGVLGVAGTKSGTTTGIAGVWGDAYAHVGVLGTSNEYTGVVGESISGTGVSGLSTSSSGVAGYIPGTTLNTAGVLGKAGAVSGDSHIVAGVWGDSYQQVGVEGTSIQSIGVYGQSFVTDGVEGVSQSGAGVAGNSTSGAGMVGYTPGGTLNTAGAIGIVGTRTNFSGIAGVWGDSANNVGVFGSSNIYAGVQGSSASAPGVQGNSTSGNGVHGVSASTSAIFGETSSTSVSDAGLYGYSHSSAQGVYGFSGKTGIHGVSVANSTTGAQGGTFENGGSAAVWGDNGADSGYGVVGTADNGTAGEFLNSSYGQSALYVVNNNSFGGSHVADFFGGGGLGCTIFGQGDLQCEGSVTGVARVNDGERAVKTYGVQSAESWSEDAGSGKLENGVAHISLEATFAQTVNASVEYHVFLTPNGDSDGLYVTNKTAEGFDVHEQHGGHASIAFDYRIMAKRAGHETERLVDVTEEMKKQAEKRAKTRRPVADGNGVAVENAAAKGPNGN